MICAGYTFFTVPAVPLNEKAREINTEIKEQIINECKTMSVRSTPGTCIVIQIDKVNP